MALTRAGIDLEAGRVRIRRSFTDRRTPGSKITLGRLKYVILRHWGADPIAINFRSRPSAAEEAAEENADDARSSELEATRRA
jgi:hypothetical protein